MAKNKGLISATKSEDDWMVSRDLETLMDAERITKDPKRLAKAQALAKKRLLDLAAVASEAAND